MFKTLVEKTEKSPDVDIIMTTLLKSMNDLYERIKVMKIIKKKNTLKL
jgi:hypothetical protein